MDQDLQRLRKQFQATGSIEDEVHYLRELLRSGERGERHYFRLAELSPTLASDFLRCWVSSGVIEYDQLLLAAFLGHEAAMTAAKVNVLAWKLNMAGLLACRLWMRPPPPPGLLDDLYESLKQWVIKGGVAEAKQIHDSASEACARVSLGTEALAAPERCQRDFVLCLSLAQLALQDARNKRGRNDQAKLLAASAAAEARRLLASLGPPALDQHLVLRHCLGWVDAAAPGE